MPKLNFWKDIAKFLDIQDYYKAYKTEKNMEGGAGLKDIVFQLRGKSLCKIEQISNWENRPLRHSQEHYAALDAWILTVLVEDLDNIIKNKKTKHSLIKTIGKPDL